MKKINDVQLFAVMLIVSVIVALGVSWLAQWIFEELR